MFSALGSLFQNIFGNILGIIFKKVNIEISVGKSEKSIVNNIYVTSNSPNQSDVDALVEKLRFALENGDKADLNRYTPDSPTAIGSTTAAGSGEKNLFTPISNRDSSFEVDVSIDLNGESVSDKNILSMLTNYGSYHPECRKQPLEPYESGVLAISEVVGARMRKTRIKAAQ